jgi:CheY-like chemotaxis protein
MYRPPPLRGRPVLDGKRVLLIDDKQATRDTRVGVLRSHGVEVDVADNLQAAGILWKPNHYHLILLDVRRYFPAEVLEFYERIRDTSPRQRIGFIVGPPLYLTRNWPGEASIEEASPGQWWEDTVKRFSKAA